MSLKSSKKIIFKRTSPANLIALLIFILVIVIGEYALIKGPFTKLHDPGFLILFGFSISPFFHLIPLSVILTLTLSFLYLTNRIATSTKRKTISNRPKAIKKPDKGTRSIKKIKYKVLNSSVIIYIKNKIIEKEINIRSAAIIIVVFLIVTFLVTNAAIPSIVPNSTQYFFKRNQGFLRFVISTQEVTGGIVKTLGPIGSIATSIHSMIISTAPSFRSTLENTASVMTKWLVLLKNSDKYIIVQNLAAWLVAIFTLLYSQYVKRLQYKR